MRRLARCMLALGLAGAAGLGPAACSKHVDAQEGELVDASADVAADRPPPTEHDDDDATSDAAVTGPALLSQTGLYADFASRTVAAELIPFAPRYELWADGAQKGRWLYLPPGAKIDTARIDHWEFPVGTKAFKEFRYGGKLVETRLLMKVHAGNGNSAWWQAAYVWRADGSDADATPAGVKGALGTGTTHDVPSQTDCRNCHGDVRDVLIGVSAIQLSDPANPATDALTAWSTAGRLSTVPPPGIDVPGSGVAREALAYLHANCGHCHNDEAKKLDTQSKLRLRLLVGQSLEQTGAYTTTVGTVMRHTLENGVTDIVVKGDPDRSGLALRPARRDFYGMPPAGTQVVDDAGVDVIRQWITSWQ